MYEGVGVANSGRGVHLHYACVCMYSGMKVCAYIYVNMYAGFCMYTRIYINILKNKTNVMLFFCFCLSSIVYVQCVNIFPFVHISKINERFNHKINVFVDEVFLELPSIGR